MRVLPHVAGLALMFVGGGGSVALMVALHSGSSGQSEVARADVVSFDVAPKAKRPAVRERRRPKPKKRARRVKAPPPPTLAASLSGARFGLASYDADLLSSASDDLLGDRSHVVMTQDAVDSRPRALTRAACPYPQRARSKHVQGSVTLSMLVQIDGGVRDLRVLSSDPSGIFDEVALECLARWRFSPATYEGQPVASRARQTLRFVLE